MATITRLESLAGVPDTPLAKAAVDLLEATSPQFICNHCVRTYVFGNLAVRSIGRSIIDEEIAFCGALLHDLGLVPAHAGENRFEVDGADAAREFCLKHQVASERADRVWEAILASYPRLGFKSAFRDLLVEHCRRNPAAQILAWTDEVARTAGCTLHGQPIPTASQLMLAAPFTE